jgi:aspartate/methionine/tyrosine aminotransferase
MLIETFKMERQQCLYENTVAYDLSGSGVPPLPVETLLGSEAEKARFLAQALRYPPSDGSPQLRERIAQFYPGSRANNVTVTNGGSEANYLTLWTLLEKGERLACQLPNYLQAWGLGRAYAEDVDAFHLELSGVPGRRHWALNIDELKRVVTPRTGVILVTNPNNPTGAVLSEAEMEAVIDVARKVKAWLVVDEIYRGAEFDGVTTPTFWGRYEKVVITAGVSKALAMPGLRLGWVVAPPKLIEKLWLHHDYLTLTPNVLSDYLATLALEPARRDALLDRTRAVLQKNWPPLAEWLNLRADLFTYAPPLAGASAYLQYKLPVKSTTLADRLRAEASVLLMPGDYFGLSKGLRFGFGGDLEKTLRGLALAENFMRQLKHKAPAEEK